MIPRNNQELIEAVVKDWTEAGDSLEDILEGLQEQPFALVSSPPTEEERAQISALMLKYNSK